MGAQCELTGKAFKTGNKVSHSNRKTKRKFNPNLHNMTLSSEVLNKVFKKRIATSTSRTIDNNGGLDHYLLNTKNNKLTPEALSIKKLIQKRIAPAVENEAEASNNED